jgi:hypothetical protein
LHCDWTLLAKHADVHRFVTLLNARLALQDFAVKWIRAMPERYHALEDGRRLRP